MKNYNSDVIIGKITIISCITLCIISIFIPIFSKGVWASYDAMAHYGRMIDINNQIKNHQFPPLFDWYSVDSIGYSWNMFYPPLSAYIQGIIGLLSFWSLSLNAQFKISIFIILAITFYVCYFISKKITSNSLKSLILSTLFVCSGSVLNNSFIRVDIGELCAIPFILMAIFGLHNIIFRTAFSWKYFPIGVSLTLLSNIPSFVVLIIGITIFLAFNIEKLINKSAMKLIFLSILSVVLFTSFFTIPVIFHYIKSDIFAFTGLPFSYPSMSDYTVDFENIFLGLKTSGLKTSDGLITSPGIPLILLFLLGFVYSYKFKNDIVLTGSLTCCLLFIFSLPLFPWAQLPEWIPAINLIQFPWRIIIFCTCLIAFYSSYTMQKINSTPYLTMILIIAAILTSYATVNANNNRYQSINKKLFEDYLPIDVHTGIKNLDAKSIKLAKERKSTSWNGVSYNIKGISGKFTTDIIGYNGYEMYIDGNKSETKKDHSGFLYVNVSNNERVEFSYSSSLTYYPWIISILFTILFITIPIAFPKK